MTTGTAVPSPTFGATGFVAPLSSAVFAGAMSDINAAFGGNLNTSVATPQGQLASSLAAIINQNNATFLQFTNLVDPALSSGRMQDAIARIYFLSRNPSTSTVVQCTCIGLPGVVIPINSLAQDQSGNVYYSTQAATIPSSGSIVVPFANQIPGATPCPANTLTIIYQAILGWDSINNSAAGVVGSNVETASQFETRRFNSVAQNSMGWVAALRGAVLSVPNVIDCYVTENIQSTTQTIGGVSLLPNSIYVAVVGGTASAVAEAIWLHKNAGASYNGNTTVTVYDTQSGYSPPYPSYSVTYQTPIGLPIHFSVSMANNGYVPANALSLIQTAIVGAFSGLDGGQRVRIGQTVFASRFYSTLASLWPNAQIVSILIGSPNNPGSTFTGSMSNTSLTVISITSGSLAVGQSIDDLSGLILAGTTIVSQTSGTAGGVGVYVISLSQSVAPEVMYGIVPSLNEISTNINQYPTIAAGDITLTLV